MTRFYLIRHALTDMVGKTLAGRLPDIYINETGREQALRLKEYLRPVKFSAIYSSPLERTMETAGYFSKEKNLDIIPMEEFFEINYGEWTGKKFESLNGDPAWKKFNFFRSTARIPGGETMAEAQSRMISGMEKIYEKHPDQSVAIVSHADLIKVTLIYYLGMPIDLMQRLEITPASVSIVDVYEETTKIILMNHNGPIQ